MTPDEAKRLIALTSAFTHLYDLYIQKAPTTDVIEAFRDTTDKLHELLRSAGPGMFREVNRVYEQWMQANDERSNGRGPSLPR